MRDDVGIAEEGQLTQHREAAQQPPQGTADQAGQQGRGPQRHGGAGGRADRAAGVEEGMGLVERVRDEVQEGDVVYLMVASEALDRLDSLVHQPASSGHGH